MTKQSHCIAGSVTAGCFSTILGHPLDTIKIYQQTHTTKSKSILDIATYLARGDVLRLFRGVGPPMANQIIMNSVMFTVFNNVKDKANQSVYLNEDSSALLAGLFAGFATACLSTPTDWFKIQAQVSLSNNNNNSNVKQIPRRYDMVSILKHQFVKDGKFDISLFTRTIYRGNISNLAREGIFTMVYLGLYDRITSAVKVRSNDTQNEPLSMSYVVIISSFTGSCAWICNYPFDTVKTAMQSSDTNKRLKLRDAIRSIYNSGGLNAFWRGIGSSTVRAMLVTSSRMLAYEKTIQLLKYN